MVKTLKELALSEISNFFHSVGSIFEPEDRISKVLGYLSNTGRKEVIAIKKAKVGILDVRNLLDVDQPHITKIERKWDQLGSINTKDKVLDVVRILQGNNVWALPVKKENEVVGIINHEDILDALIDVEELNNIEVKEIAQKKVTTIGVNEGISHARRLMLNNDYSQIPVIEKGRLVGIITAEDIVHTFITPMDRTTRGDRASTKGSRLQGKVIGIMDRQPYTVNQNTKILQVVKDLRELDKTAAVVLSEEGEIQGIISKRDIISVLLRADEPEELPVFIVGITDENFFEKAVAEEKVKRIVEKNILIYPDITEVNIQVKKQRTQGERTLYGITGHLYGPYSQFKVKHENWGLLEAFDGFCDALDKSLKRAKKKPQKGVRYGRRRPNPNLKP